MLAISLILKNLHHDFIHLFVVSNHIRICEARVPGYCVALLVPFLALRLYDWPKIVEVLKLLVYCEEVLEVAYWKGGADVHLTGVDAPVSFFLLPDYSYRPQVYVFILTE